MYPRLCACVRACILNPYSSQYTKEKMSDWFVPPQIGNNRRNEKNEEEEKGGGGEEGEEERNNSAEHRGKTNHTELRTPVLRRRQKLYEIWPGNDKFFWDGRIIVGPNYKAFYRTVLLVFVPSIVFTSLVVPSLSKEYSWAWQVVSVLWPLYVVACLIRTGTMDPGILPKLPRPPPRNWNDPPRERTRDVEHAPTKKIVTVKWNDTTNFFQPPRAHHCSINNDCVEKFDHHCPWVGTTIGRRNYRNFLYFVFGTTLWCAFVVGSCVMSIIVEIDKRNDFDAESGETVNTSAVVEALRASGAAMFCGVVAFFGFIFVFALSAFHVVLISQNQTTYENFREKGEDNPYTHGNCFKNWCEIFFEPRPPSWFNFRGFADEDDSAERFSEHMRARGLLLHEQDPEVARKETEKRLAEFNEDLEKAKEKIAYKQNLELSESNALKEEEKNREDDGGIATKVKNAFANVFGNASSEKSKQRQNKNDDDDVENANRSVNRGFESPGIDEDYIPDIIRRQQSSDDDGGSELSVSSRASSSHDIDERKRRFQFSGEEGEEEEEEEEEEIVAAAEEDNNNNNDLSDLSSSSEEDEFDETSNPSEADDEEQSDLSSSDDDDDDDDFSPSMSENSRSSFTSSHSSSSSSDSR